MSCGGSVPAEVVEEYADETLVSLALRILL